MLWPSIAFAAASFCIVRGVLDMRNHRYIWGAVGILAGIALLLMPIRSQAVKMDFPPAKPG